jgi:hypothetical protein
MHPHHLLERTGTEEGDVRVALSSNQQLLDHLEPPP